MALSFPNPSRRYDRVRRQVCFWAYDRALEVPIFLDESVLFHLDPETAEVEAGMLATFDAARDRIHAVAQRVHSFKKRGFYVLVTSDF
jgi:uncharacterized protein DUF1488